MAVGSRTLLVDSDWKAVHDACDSAREADWPAAKLPTDGPTLKAALEEEKAEKARREQAAREAEEARGGGKGAAKGKGKGKATRTPSRPYVYAADRSTSWSPGFIRQDYDDEFPDMGVAPARAPRQSGHLPQHCRNQCNLS